MRRLIRTLLALAAVLAVAVATVIGIRLVNDHRHPALAGADPADPAAYDTTIPGVRAETIDDGDLQGIRLVPQDVAHDGVVVIFGGSEGGLDWNHARLLAENGYEVWAMFFFGRPGQSSELVQVDLGFFDDLTARIDAEARRPGPLTVIGTSKGAELSLVLARDSDAIDNAVLFSPETYVQQGLTLDGGERSSWTREGTDVPHLSFRDAGMGALAHQVSAAVLAHPVSYRSTYEHMRETSDPAVLDAARLDPSAVPGGLLVFAGGQDLMWPADTAAGEIAEARPDAEVHIYPEAGHVFAGDGVIGKIRTGGTRVANDAARADSDAILLERMADWHG